MHGVSEVIAIILILMITISLAGLAYMFMSTTISDVTSSAGSTVDTTTSSMITSFTIENMDIDKVYVRNTGQSVLTDLSVYVNDEPANYNITPSSIASGAVGTITIYSFIPDGAVVKLTSPSGFSTSKVVNECSKSVACWKLDEGTGAVAYDSSPYGNSGMLINGPIWSVGKHGSGLLFDGTNDYVDLSFTYSSNTISLIVWLKINKVGASFQNYVASSSFGIWGWPPGGSDTVQIALTSTNTTGNSTHSYATVPTDTWLHIVVTKNETVQRLFVNGVLKDSDTVFGRLANITELYFGRNVGGANYFNGTIDEVRIYDRAIY